MRNSKFLIITIIAIPIVLTLQSCIHNTIETKEAKRFGIGFLQEIKNISHLINEPDLVEEINRTELLESGEKIDFSQAKQLTNLAKLIAGIEVTEDENLAAIEKTKQWLKHHQFSEKSWLKLSKTKTSSIQQWREQELNLINHNDFSVFFPFSSANFFKAYTLFPQSKEFILVGSESIGEIPSLNNFDRFELDIYLEEVRNSIYNILPVDYLRTNNFFQDSPEQNIMGALLVFLARFNSTIVDVSNIGLNNQGNIQALQPRTTIPGIKITFIAEQEKTPRYLYYFQHTLANEEIDQLSGIKQFIADRQNIVTYLDRASYLMHFDSFSRIRDLILSQSKSLLQNDSGIPLDFFDRHQWDLKFYGNYTRPITLFHDRYQPNLRQIYQSNFPINPLQFATGYQSKADKSNLMLGIREK